MAELDPLKIKRIYFVGIKGVGMCALSIIAKEAGFIVSGSDVAEEFITDSVLLKNGIKVATGFNTGDLASFAGERHDEVLVVTTAAHGGLSNPQSLFAKTNNIQILTHGQAVGAFMEGNLFGRKLDGVSVLGCHGKTTITAMTAVAFLHARLDPSYAVGTSELFPSTNPGHYGQGNLFIAEADEFISDVEKDRTVKFLYQFPKYAIINNIDFDHPDVYKDLSDVKKTFQTFCLNNIQTNGVLVCNGDDENVLAINQELSTRRRDLQVITYGEGNANDIRIQGFKEAGWGSEFEVISKGASLGLFKLSVPGYYNAKNILSVIALMQSLEIGLETIREAVAVFQGTKRRQEKVGESKNGAIVLDDYAHHPDEIDKTLTAIKKAFPNRKIICLFQPHTLSRTQALWQEFAKSFNGADEVLFLPIFTSKREGETGYTQLYDSIKKSMNESGTKVEFLADERSQDELQEPPYFHEKNRSSVVEYISSHFDSPEFVVLTLGAGDLYKIAYDLVLKNA